MQRLIIIRGYPGSGKTTAGKLLEQNGCGTFIDHNAILNFIAGIIGDDEDIQKEIHDLEKAMVRKLLLDKRSVIVARGFSSERRINEYVDIAKHLNVEALVFRLSVPMNLLEKRVENDERKSDFNPTTRPDALHKWVSSNPLEEYPGEIVIDAQNSAQEVFSAIRAYL